MLSFQRMDVYRRAVEFLALVAKIERQAQRGNAPLQDQLRRAATSISLNIAEAAGRTGRADAARVYAIARGSAMECAAVLDALSVLGSIAQVELSLGTDLLGRIVAMLTRLCRLR
jgi:four helix bundle protein